MPKALPSLRLLNEKMMKPIEVHQLCKSFKLKGKAVKALDSISFELKLGESVGFIGQNGAGKSTTIKVLFGALKPDSGEAHLMGLPASDPKSRQRVGYVPENPYLYNLLTPRELIASGLRLHGFQKPDIQQKTQDWLEKLDIAHAADKCIRNLSKGMTQRTALAHAFALNPILLILDEPMSGLDPVGRRLVADLMQEYRQAGGTLFFSSHILHDIEILADRFIMIHKGKICIQQSLADLLANQSTLVIRYYGDSPLLGFAKDTGMIWKGCFDREKVQSIITEISKVNGVLIDITPLASLEKAFSKIINSFISE